MSDDDPPAPDSARASAPASRVPAAAGWAIALAQGALLFWLHRAIEARSWPATEPGLLAPACLLATFLPASALLFARHLDQRAAQAWLAAQALVLAFLGWHFGARVLPDGAFRGLPRSDALVFASLLPLTVLWLLAQAFARVRIEGGRWRSGYPALFLGAWKNAIALLEALAFTGFTWLLLMLCAALFDAIGIRFFRDLFTEPAFFYPATTLAFAIALRLIDDVGRMVDVVLEQVLNVLKWLAPLAGLIVTGFAIALLPRLPAMFASGQKVIGAAALLWLVALTVLLLNAAYQDGRAPRPYGPRLSAAMRVVPVATAVLAVTALASVLVRIGALGLTLERYWGLFVALCALGYALAYAVAALRPERGRGWMRALGAANPLLAVVLAAGLALSLTPVLSPYRLSAASQMAVARTTGDEARQLDALRVLAFESGRYGRRALDALAAPAAAGVSPVLRQRAVAMRARRDPYAPPRPSASDRDAWLAAVRVHPADRPLPAPLQQALRAQATMPPPAAAELPPHALWLDLLDAPGDELLLLLPTTGLFEIYAPRDSGAWSRVERGLLRGRDGGLDASKLEAALAAGDYGTVPPRLPELRIGGRRLRLDAAGDAMVVPMRPDGARPEPNPAPGGGAPAPPPASAGRRP